MKTIKRFWTRIRLFGCECFDRILADQKTGSATLVACLQAGRFVSYCWYWKLKSRPYVKSKHTNVHAERGNKSFFCCKRLQIFKSRSSAFVTVGRIQLGPVSCHCIRYAAMVFAGRTSFRGVFRVGRKYLVTPPPLPTIKREEKGTRK